MAMSNEQKITLFTLKTHTEMLNTTPMNFTFVAEFDRIIVRVVFPPFITSAADKLAIVTNIAKKHFRDLFYITDHDDPRFEITYSAIVELPENEF